MRIYPGTTVDYEFKQLGDLGYTGTLNDRQFAALRAEGLTGSLPDMFKQFDGTLGGVVNPWNDTLALITNTKGWALDPTDATRLWDDSGRTILIGTPPLQIAAIDSDSNTSGFLGQKVLLVHCQICLVSLMVS